MMIRLTCDDILGWWKGIAASGVRLLPRVRVIVQVRPLGRDDSYDQIHRIWAVVVAMRKYLSFGLRKCTNGCIKININVNLNGGRNLRFFPAHIKCGSRDNWLM
jgi:hypothetical protein